MTWRCSICLLALGPLWSGPGGTRLKDLVSIEGVRDNQLVGYGLVVGLNGTGDKRQTVFSSQSLTNLLARMGVQVSPTAILVRNTAAVLVTTDLPPFAQPGTRIDISVAAIGDATNLQGGILVLTPMKGPDGQVYAAGQGSVVTGGFVAGRGGGSSQTVNHPTAGRVPNGAIIEKLAPSVAPGGHIKLQLRRPTSLQRPGFQARSTRSSEAMARNQRGQRIPAWSRWTPRRSTNQMSSSSWERSKISPSKQTGPPES